MVVWPDIAKAGASRSARWFTGPVANTTALQFFQRTTVLNHVPSTTAWWHHEWHSQQQASGGVAQYGIAVESRRNNVRWGYAFNDGHTWDTEEGDAVRS